MATGFLGMERFDHKALSFTLGHNSTSISLFVPCLEIFDKIVGRYQKL